MNNQRHKRKESLSVLLISNTGRENRQFNIPLPVLRIVPALFLILLVLVGWLSYEFSINHKTQSALHTQLAEQEALVQQLTEEKEQLNTDNQTLSEENSSLRQQIEETAEEEEAEEAEEEAADPTEDPSYPSRYPYSGASVLLSSYTEEQPYLAISAYTGGTVIAAGDGTVLVSTSDDIYQHIIEVVHESGYKTRYLCHQSADVAIEEGAEVHAGDLLLTITTDETQLDYQVIYEEAPVDPLSVIDARG